MNDHYDVIVSGAGPSGSRTAYLCAREGLSVLLLDRKAMPREKCCAGGVLYRAMRLIGEQAERAPRQCDVHGVRVLLGARAYEWHLQEELGFTVLRKDLDAYLAIEAQKAGCELMLGTKVTFVREDRDKVSVTSEQGIHFANLMVIAEGAASGNATRSFGPYPKGGVCNGAALLCEKETGFEGMAGVVIPRKGVGPEPSRQGTGICAAFPVKEGLVLSTVSNASSSSLRAILDEVARCHGIHPSGSFCAHPIPVIARRRLATRRCLAVGDCAGLASPFTGEGLSPGLESANIAAEVIVSSMRTGQLHLERYEARVRAGLQMNQLRARITGAAVHLATCGRWAGTILSGLEDDPAFRKAILDVARRESGAGSFLPRLLPRLPAIIASGIGR